MSKFDTFHQYPSRGLSSARSVLLTIWPTLNRFHDDLVLVGGLAVDCLTKPEHQRFPGAVTMDVDLGISLASESGLYGGIMIDLKGLGFQKDVRTNNRVYLDVEGMRLYLDFLTELKIGTSGSVMISDIVADVVLGIDRALESRRFVELSGTDIWGAQQTCNIAVSDIGPLLVLKINAFGGPTGRRHPKDAYDVLLAVTTFIDGPEEAIRLFHEEANQNNSGYENAVTCLKHDFVDPDQDAPIRAAHFLAVSKDEQMSVREEVATVGRFLLGM